jgi:hypothetical protein
MKNNRDFNNCMKCYKPRTCITDDEKGDFVGGFHSSLVKWKKIFSQVLKVQRVNYVTYNGVPTAWPEWLWGWDDYWKLKDTNHQVMIKSQRNWLLQGVGQSTLWSINFNSIWKKEELLDEWKESIILLNYNKGGETDFSNYRGISLLPIMCKSIDNILLSKLTLYAKDIIGDRQCDCRRNIICIRQTLEKKRGIQWGSALAFYRLQESLWFSHEGGPV